MKRSTLKVVLLALCIGFIVCDPVDSTYCDHVAFQSKDASGNNDFGLMKLDTSARFDILQYRIRWADNNISMWYQPGFADIDTMTNADGTPRRMWAYFGNYSYDLIVCDDNYNEAPLNITVPDKCIFTWTYWEGALNNTEFADYGLDISAHPEILQYRYQAPDGVWSQWYVPGQDDLANDTNAAGNGTRLWENFDNDNHEYIWCDTGSGDIGGLGDAIIVTETPLVDGSLYMSADNSTDNSTAADQSAAAADNSTASP